ncbi:MAG: hypothetical protein ONB41_25265, partial [candidate division KSB1 bacterium]|nr:hypothetical protein [candidate division KSB1 bacterium]
MKTRSHVFAIHFSVIAFELFCPQLVCLSEKLAALDKMSALLSSENKFVVAPLGVGLPTKVERLKATRQTFIFIIIGCRARHG